MKRFSALCSLTSAFGLMASAALASQPTPGGYDFQPAATKMMESLQWFKDYTNWFIIPITIFVLLLLIYVCVRFREKANPIPSKNAHNTTIEVIWTALPILILVALAIPSFEILFNQYPTKKADITIKAVGHQWYWSYEYPDHGNFTFDSVMLQEKEIKDPKTQPRLLAVDNEMVVPVGKTVHVITTAADVIHAFAVPAFGVKADAVPGRVNGLFFKAEKTGVFYGQCSELCGKDHAFMPIAVRVLSEPDFAKWVEGAKKKYSFSSQFQTASAE